MLCKCIVSFIKNSTMLSISLIMQ
uniref:Uncharacterized protein n=1 Tax=Anguilla anguilla TaxID=7936 RepID=A0A0E9SA78_ANGAN